MIFGSDIVSFMIIEGAWFAHDRDIWIFDEYFFFFKRFFALELLTQGVNELNSSNEL